MGSTLPKLRALREIREGLFMTQEELANKAGVTRVTISRIERQEIEPRFSTIKRIARALKVQPSVLVGSET